MTYHSISRITDFGSLNLLPGPSKAGTQLKHLHANQTPKFQLQSIK